MYIYSSYSLFFGSYSYGTIPGPGASGKSDAGDKTNGDSTSATCLKPVCGNTPEPAPLLSAPDRSSKVNEHIPGTKGDEGQATALRFEYLRVSVEKARGMRNAETRAREGFGHKVARRRALRRNTARFLKHLTRKIGKELRRFIREGDLTEEQVSKLRDAFQEFKGEVKDLLHSLSRGGNLDPDAMKESLHEMISSFINGIDEALSGEAQPGASPGEAIPITDSIPVNKEPVPVISDGFEEKSETGTLPVDISTSGKEGSVQDIEGIDYGAKNDLRAIADGLKARIERIFDKTMKRISKMLDKLVEAPPRKPGNAYREWSIEIDYISIYRAFVSKEAPEIEPAPEIADEERPTLYA